MNSLSLALLGSFQARLGLNPLQKFRTSRVQALLVYLAVERKQHRREALMELLWPGLQPKSVQVNLRQTLYQLRKMVPEVIARDGKTAVPLLLSNRHTVQMHPDAAIDLDTSTFDCLVQQVGKSEDLKLLEQAIALYRGDFLFDFYLPDSTPFDEWANARRAAYRRLVLDMLQSLTTLQMQNKWFDRAETAVRHQLSIDPLNDIAHRQLIELLARSGRRTEALAQYDRYCRLLVDELGVEPSAATLVLHQQVTSGYFDTTSTNQLRGYELGDEIGHGTFGVVYRAKQPVVARDVAIKIIGPQYTNNPHFTQRFEHEAQLVARLEHPYIVPLYDYWQDANGAYLVMRYLRGGNLEAFLTKGACEIETAVSIIDQIASALATAHKQGIVHRDIKPANILLDEEGNAYLSDFGIAKDLKGDLNLTMDGTIIGSPKYISPEQVRQEPVSPQTDIYSLGIVLYEILTGHPPFMDDSIVDLVSRHLNDPLPSVLARQPALPATIDAIIQQATAKNPTDRFPDMLAFKTAFHNAMAATTPLPQMPPPLPTHPKHNLPAQPTRFVGREQELADLQTWLMNPYSRLITIVGSGGMGKTRLALAAAARHLSAQNARYPDGVFFVPLAALQQPDEIVSKVAQSVNLPMESKTGRSPTQQLLDFLRGKQILLILDNFEHLMDGATLLADMLSAAPKLQILATSRERLQLYEEQVFAITGLTFPQETAVSTPDTLAEYTAVQLFLDRTQRILPDYRLMKTDATHLARLCQIVDGTPLALELAASWMDSIPLPDIVAEIQQNLDFLETNLRNVPERHRSMRAVFDTTWQRLNDDEQTVLAQLSVFRGDFTLAAATEVANANLRILTRLVRLALVQADGENGRYTLHELLNQYAKKQLAEQPGGNADINIFTQVQERHTRYYCQLLQQQENRLKGENQVETLASLDSDLDNIQAAWNRAVTNKGHVLLRQAMESLWLFYWTRGLHERGERTFYIAVKTIEEDLPDLPKAAQKEQLLLAGLLTFQCVFTHHKKKPPLIQKIQSILQRLDKIDINTYRESSLLLRQMHIQVSREGRYDEVLEIAKQNLDLCQTAKDKWRMAYALRDAGSAAYYAGMHEQGAKWLEQSLLFFRQQGDRRGEADALHNLALVIGARGNLEAEETLKRESLALFEEIENIPLITILTQEVATTLVKQGHFSESIPLFTKSISQAHHWGQYINYPVAKTLLSQTKLLLGEYEQADLLATECLNVMSPQEMKSSLHGFLLRILGAVAIVQHKNDKATNLLKESLEILQRINKPNLGLVHALLSIPTLSLNELSEAAYHLRQALKKVNKHGDFLSLLWTLPAIALYMAKRNQNQRALTIFALARQAPYVANACWFADVVGKPLAEVAATLPPDVVQAAEERGRGLDLWETAVSLLRELEVG